MLDLLFYLGYYAKYCFIFNESIYAEIVTTIMGFQKEAYHVTKFVDKGTVSGCHFPVQNNLLHQIQVRKDITC